MEYKTTHRGAEIEYYYDERRVSIHRNGEFWGSPQGERFVVALLEDIEKYRKEISALRGITKGAN